MHGMLPSLAQFGGVWEDVLTSLQSIVESSSLFSQTQQFAQRNTSGTEQDMTIFHNGPWIHYAALIIMKSFMSNHYII